MTIPSDQRDMCGKAMRLTDRLSKDRKLSYEDRIFLVTHIRNNANKWLDTLVRQEAATEETP